MTDQRQHKPPFEDGSIDTGFVRAFPTAAPPATAPKTLQIFVHGLRRLIPSKTDSSHFDQIVTFDNFAAAATPDADRAAVLYECGAFWGNCPFEIVADLEDALVLFIAAREEALKTQFGAEFRFERFVIVAHSLGGLLARKAIAWLRGHYEDHPSQDRGFRARTAWVGGGYDSVRFRLVLVAGMTRGWTMGTVGQRLLQWWLTISGWWAFRLVLDVMRGTRFVTNLRIQWVRATGANDPGEPEVVQVVGEDDPLIATSDHYDLEAGQFALLRVPELGHLLLREIGEQHEQLREVLQDALTGSLSGLRGRLEAQGPRPGRTRHDAKSIVFIMHGIRDNLDWCRELATMITVTSTGEGGNTHCVTSSYGHFPMLGFLSIGRRKAKVRWFMDRYAEELSLCPHLIRQNPDTAIPVHFVGHSNGTYLLAEGLRTYESLKVNRAALMGSIVPADFPWDEFSDADRIRELRNDRGSADWVVGWFPTFYQTVRIMSFNLIGWPTTNDLGNGGFRGFDRSVRRHHENYYFPGGHSAMITRENLKSIAHYIVNGNNMETPTRLVRSPNAFVFLVSRLCWLLWIALMTFFIGGAIYLGMISIWYAVAWVIFWLLVLETA